MCKPAAFHLHRIAIGPEDIILAVEAEFVWVNLACLKRNDAYSRCPKLTVTSRKEDHMAGNRTAPVISIGRVLETVVNLGPCCSDP